MKGNETILPKTEITTTYDDNGNLITEVKEDYDTNKISITFPEYYLTGSTEMPTQKPQIPEGEYKILIYQTYTASTPLTQKPIHLIQMPFNLTFYHHDHLGTTRYITNENGEILHTTDTLAYGEELTSPYENDKDEVLNTITYTGHEKDYETGLTYMLARYYSQGYGRFLSPDPGYDYDQLDPMSWNLYSYVRGNPIKSLDPTGEMVIYINSTLFSTGDFTIEFQGWEYYFKKPAFWGMLFLSVGDIISFYKKGKVFQVLWETAKNCNSVCSEVSGYLNGIRTDFSNVLSFETFGDIIAFEQDLKDFVLDNWNKDVAGKYKGDPSLKLYVSGINKDELNKLLKLIYEFIDKQRKEGKVSKEEAKQLKLAYREQIKKAKEELKQIEKDKELQSQFMTHEDEWNLIFASQRGGL